MDGAQEHVVRPEVRAQFRSRLDEPWMEELLAIQAAAAMEDGLVRPAPVVVDTWPRAHGSPRVTDAATLSKAPKPSSSASPPYLPSAPHKAQRWRRRHTNSLTTAKR